MQLINCHRLVQAVMFTACRLPVPVSPFVVQIPHNGRIFRRYLVENRKGIGFISAVAGEARSDMILIKGFFRCVCKESFPDSRLTARMECVAGFVPAIEIADYGDPLGIGRPHREIGTPLAAVRYGMSPQLIVKAKMLAFIEKIDIVVRQKTYCGLV